MRKALKSFFLLAILSLLTGLISACASNSINGLDKTVSQKSKSQSTVLSAKQCTDLGGELVGDIGDGRIHEADYLCNNGTSPIGTIKTQDEPVMTEGAVCCGP